MNFCIYDTKIRSESDWDKFSMLYLSMCLIIFNFFKKKKTKKNKKKTEDMTMITFWLECQIKFRHSCFLLFWWIAIPKKFQKIPIRLSWKWSFLVKLQIYTLQVKKNQNLGVAMFFGHSWHPYFMKIPSI